MSEPAVNERFGSVEEALSWAFNVAAREVFTSPSWHKLIHQPGKLRDAPDVVSELGLWGCHAQAALILGLARRCTVDSEWALLRVFYGYDLEPMKDLREGLRRKIKRDRWFIEDQIRAVIGRRHKSSRAWAERYGVSHETTAEWGRQIRNEIEAWRLRVVGRLYEPFRGIGVLE